VTETSTQLERRAEKARERLSDHLQELQHNVSPATVLSDIFDLNPRKWGADDAAQLLIEQVKTNPVACMLIAAARIVMDLLRRVAVDQSAAIIVVTHDEMILDRFDHIFRLPEPNNRRATARLDPPATLPLMQQIDATRQRRP
jgi:hypothetical protein